MNWTENDTTEYIKEIIITSFTHNKNVVIGTKSGNFFSGSVRDIFKNVVEMIENGNNTTITYVMLSEIESIKIIK